MADPDSPKSVFENCADYLAQGDIFDLSVLTVHHEIDCRVLRQHDGSPIPSDPTGAVEIKFFDHKTLEHFHEMETVACAPINVRRFIVASQTCDISGVDKPQFPVCLAARVVSIQEFVRDTVLPLPLRDDGKEVVKEIRIPEYSQTFLGSVDKSLASQLEGAWDDEFRLPDLLRKVLAEWKKAKKPPELVAFRTKLKNTLDKFVGNKTSHLYYLPRSQENSLPESFVDLSALYPLVTERLEEAKSQRIGTIRSPAKEHFSKQLGDCFSRVALEKPIVGEKFG